MKGGAAVAFLIVGAAAIYVLWDLNRRKTISGTAAGPSAATVNGYTQPVVAAAGPQGGSDSLQRSIDALAKSISAGAITTGVVGGTAVGGVTGGAVGGGVSSGEQGLARGLGVTGMTDAQIASLERNSASNGLAAGATGGANVAGVGGGAVGGFLGNLFPSFGKAAAAPLADATPLQPGTRYKSVYDVPFLGGIYHGTDAVFGGQP